MMLAQVEGHEVFGHTGGVEPAFDDQAVLLIHGAGNDHSVWRYQTRLLAGLGLPVLAVDLPGHGRSGGPARTSVPALAQWVVALLDELQVGRASIVGHSMGSLTAVATAAMDPARVRRIALIGTSPSMGVHPDLQTAADSRDPVAIDLIVGWSHTARSRYGGHRQAGVWTTQQTRRLLERNLGPLGGDLAACAVYNAQEAAAGLDVDALVISGERDAMTPARAGEAMADLLGGRCVVIPGGSHVSLYDHPDLVNAALVPWLQGAC
ncbi:MAG: alpha/beta fold hydrolase [Euzebya sp.]